MTELRANAHEYADLGWPLFPCEPRGKRPLGRLVPHGLKEATTDHIIIDTWWHQEPQANIGLVTGALFDVLDIDSDAGMEALVDAMPTRAATVDGPTITTSKGCHVYVAATGLGNRAAFLCGLDWRGVGGYVLAPRSIHPTGAAYRWLLGEDDPDFGARAEIRPAPAWLLGLLRKPKVVPRIPLPRDRKSSPSGVYGRKALESEVGRVVLAPVGQRNDALNRAAFAVGQLVASGVLDFDEVVDALLLAAERAGLGRNEAEKTIASGLVAAADKPRGIQA